MKIASIRLLILSAVLLSFNLTFATNNPPPPVPPPPPGLPIDGGLMVLALLSFAFASYKIYKKKRVL